MQLKLREIFEAQPVLLKISQANLPFKTAYRLSRIISKLKDEVIIINEKRTELIKKYGSETAKDVFTVDEKNIPTYKKEFDEILDTDAEFDIQLFTPDLLETLTMNAEEVLSIKKFIQEVESDGAK